MMEIYLVGGAVRDHLLGKESQDRDYVVVGGSVVEMESLGYKQVGASFPVFLHPETGEEYALARRERKVGKGYHGFETEFGKDVTLEEDLSRRDLTINAMAMTPNGQLIDPFSGYDDLRAGRLRHVGPAFAEDPLRVLRVARFVARYNFSVMPETTDLCQKLVWSNELNLLSADRFWKEFSRLITEPYFEEGIDFLELIDAISTVPYLRQLLRVEKPWSRPIESNLPRKLTFTERLFFYTNISLLPQTVLEALRIPSPVSSRLKLMKKLIEVGGIFGNAAPCNLDQVTTVLKFFDRHREALKDSVSRAQLISLASLDSLLGEIVEKQVFGAADKIYALDIAKVIEGVPPEQIKKVIFEVRTEALREFLGEIK